MAEKKQVLYDLRVTYNGPFIAEEFYAEVGKWMNENGFELEPKKKMEHVTKNGKRIEWHIEAHRRLDDLHHGIVVMRALLDNVREVVVKNNNKKMRINTGDIYINIDGFIDSHVHGSFYQMKPIYYFFRSLVDRYVYNFWSFKWDGAVSSDCHSLFKRIRAYFQVQKYKYE